MIAKLTVSASRLERSRLLKGTPSHPIEEERLEGIVELKGRPDEARLVSSQLGAEVLIVSPQPGHSRRAALLKLAELVERLDVEPLSVYLRSHHRRDFPELLLSGVDFRQLFGDGEQQISITIDPDGEHDPCLSVLLDSIIVTALISWHDLPRWTARSLGASLDDAVTVEPGPDGSFSWWATNAKGNKAGPCAGYRSEQEAEQAAARWLRAEAGGAP